MSVFRFIIFTAENGHGKRTRTSDYQFCQFFSWSLGFGFQYILCVAENVAESLAHEKSSWHSPPQPFLTKLFIFKPKLCHFFFKFFWCFFWSHSTNLGPWTFFLSRNIGTYDEFAAGLAATDGTTEKLIYFGVEFV